MTDRISSIKLAHVEVMIARGEFVPMRKRHDTKMASSDNLRAVCGKCGKEFRYSWKARIEPEVCEQCKHRVDTKAKTSHDDIVLTSMAGMDWATVKQIAAAANLGTDRTQHLLASLAKEGRVSRRKRGDRRGVEWRIV